VDLTHLFSFRFLLSFTRQAKAACLFSLYLIGLTGLNLSAWAQSDKLSNPEIKAQLIIYAPQGADPGQTILLGLQMTHSEGWHTYWLNPGDSGLATQFEWKLPLGWSAGEIVWPLPKKIRVSDLTNYGFEDTVVLGVPVVIPADFKTNRDSVSIGLKASWLICKVACIPQEGTFELRLPIKSSYALHANLFEALKSQQAKNIDVTQNKAQLNGHNLQIEVKGLPANWAQQSIAVFPEQSEVLASSVELQSTQKPIWKNGVWSIQAPLHLLRTTEPKQLSLILISGDANRSAARVVVDIEGVWPKENKTPPSPRSIASTDITLGLFAALMGAFLGGLLLNLMPCVLPVLAIKMVGMAHNKNSNPYGLASAYALGVLMICWGLGFALLLLRASGEQLGWGFQLQSPWVVTALSILFTLIALNLWDVWSLNGTLGARLAALRFQNPYLDEMASGMLSVVVATPCTAPMMGAAMGLALALPIWQSMLIFSALGLGVATPVVLLTVLPFFRKLMPQPGPWMGHLRHALAFPMLGTVIWLSWVLGNQNGVDAMACLWLVLLFITLLLWSLKFNNKLNTALSFLIACLLALVVIQWAGLLFKESALINEQSSQQKNGWQPWSEERVTQALNQGQPVFVDFTAAWCITCQVNKKTTLSSDSVLKHFADKKVLLLRADWTRRDSAISNAIEKLGRSGVPVYVLYRRQQDARVFSELLSSKEIHQALDGL
jgi:thiol:disulfide interchange protein